jgi:uncharacterized protein (DUF2147 family)
MGRTKAASSWLLAIGSVVLLSGQTVGAADTNPGKTVFGYWKAVDKETGRTQSIFRLWEDKGKLLGKIVKLYPKPDGTKQSVCTECPGNTKGKPVEGLIFFWNFQRDDGSSTKWVDGRVLNPEDGKTYNCEVELSEDGKTLKVFGYIRLLFKVGGTSVWQRPTAEELKGVPGAGA